MYVVKHGTFSIFGKGLCAASVGKYSSISIQIPPSITTNATVVIDGRLVGPSIIPMTSTRHDSVIVFKYNVPLPGLYWIEFKVTQIDKDSITLVFRYFVVRSSSMLPSAHTGSYDRPCVFHESAKHIAKRIKSWQEDRPGTVLVDPDVIVFNAGNWESNEIWDAELFGQDVKKRAEALSTGYRSGRSKVIFIGPPFYDDQISEACPDKRGLKTSLKVQKFTQAAMNALLVEQNENVNDNVVEFLDLSNVTEKGAPYQMTFWNRLKWCGGRYEMCANHQTPSMYKLMWKMLTNLTYTVGGKK